MPDIISKTYTQKNGKLVITIIRDNGVKIVRELPMALGKQRLQDQRDADQTQIDTVAIDITTLQTRKTELETDRDKLDIEIAKLP